MYSKLKRKNRIEPEDIVTVCAWCHRARIITSDFRIIWTPNYLLADNQTISHTICPSCKESVMAESDALVAFGCCHSSLFQVASFLQISYP